MLSDPLIEARSLSKHFPVGSDILGRPTGAVKAVEDVSFAIRRGEVMGLVGESGSGKSTLGRLLLRLVEPTSGEIMFDGEPIAELRPRALTALRRRMQMIFQDPYSSLNRYFTIERTLTEPPAVHGVGDRAERRDRAIRLLDRVGFGPEVLARYPHEFSGGQRQRIGIARALILEPDLIVADEPVSALDVSVQAQVLNILSDLRRDLALTMLFVTHDLSVVRQIADRIVVLYLGRIMEIAPAEAVFHDGAHPYTRSLVASAPSVRRDRRVATPVRGEMPNPLDPPSGCPFRTRCPDAAGICAKAPMTLRDLGDGRSSACVRQTPASAPNRSTSEGAVA